MTIMTVEDNPYMRQAIKQSLDHVATTILECGDGNEAIALYALHRPDWVLMDIGLPTLDGLKAARTILATHPEAKIIVVTQYDDPEMREEARSAGALHYVLKENLAEIRTAITNHSHK